MSINIIHIITAWVISIILFAVLIIYISKHSQKRTAILKTIFIIMFLGGMALYCACYYFELKQVENTPSEVRYMGWVKNENASWFYIPYVIVRSVVDVGMMFYGRSSSDVFYSEGTLQTQREEC